MINTAADLDQFFKDAIANDPIISHLAAEIRRTIPDRIVESAVAFDSQVNQAIIDVLAQSLNQIDVQAIAKQVLSNESLKGRVAIQINDLGLGLEERIKSAITTQLRQEHEQIRNLLAARRAKTRAEKRKSIGRRDELRAQREIAIAKGELLWLQWTKPVVALPVLLLAVLLGWGIRGVQLPDLTEQANPQQKVQSLE
jgi:hypothetical protein